MARTQTKTKINDIGNTMSERHAAYLNAFDAEKGVTLTGTSWKRVIVSFIANMATVATGYYGGWMAADIMASAALALTGSSFLAFVVLFLGVMVGLVAALVSGARVGKYILSGAIDDDYRRAKSWVTGLFKSTPVDEEPARPVRRARARAA